MHHGTDHPPLQTESLATTRSSPLRSQLASFPLPGKKALTERGSLQHAQYVKIVRAERDDHVDTTDDPFVLLERQPERLDAEYMEDRYKREQEKRVEQPHKPFPDVSLLPRREESRLTQRTTACRPALHPRS